MYNVRLFNEDLSVEYKPKLIKFSGGEPHVDVSNLNIQTTKLVIYIDYKSDSDVLAGVLLGDALVRQSPYSQIVYYVPYFPGARQDRYQENFGFTMKIYARMFSGFEVVTLDAHNPNALRVELDKYRNIECKNAFSTKDWLWLDGVIAPDRGALNRAASVSKRLGCKLLEADKVRDSTTGALSGFSIDVSGCSEDDSLLIVDDICDGGGTFLGLAEKIKNDRPDITLYLFVTHGIFSSGLELLSKCFDGIFTCNNINNLKVSELKSTLGMYKESL